MMMRSRKRDWVDDMMAFIFGLIVATVFFTVGHFILIKQNPHETEYTQYITEVSGLKELGR